MPVNQIQNKPDVAKFPDWPEVRFGGWYEDKFSDEPKYYCRVFTRAKGKLWSDSLVVSGADVVNRDDLMDIIESQKEVCLASLKHAIEKET